MLDTHKTSTSLDLLLDLLPGSWWRSTPCWNQTRLSAQFSESEPIHRCICTLRSQTCGWATTTASIGLEHRMLWDFIDFTNSLGVHPCKVSRLVYTLNEHVRIDHSQGVGTIKLKIHLQSGKPTAHDEHYVVWLHFTAASNSGQVRWASISPKCVGVDSVQKNSVHAQI